MVLSDLARSRLAELAGGRGRRILPMKKMPMPECASCGWMVPRSRYRKTCARCGGAMPPKPPFLCRLCDEPCPGRRSSWCSDECMEAYFTATDSNWLRNKVERRDKGVCVACGLDTRELDGRLTRMSHEQRRDAHAVLKANGFNAGYPRTTLWDADHIEPLDEGGSWEMENVQTLCQPCHKDKTAEQAARRGKQQRLIGNKWRRTQEFLRLSQGDERC